MGDGPEMFDWNFSNCRNDVSAGVPSATVE